MAPEKILFLRHLRPKVEKDRPHSEWGLDYSARKALEDVLSSGKLAGVGRIVSSTERKALLTAKEISDRLGIPLEETPLASEVDRRKSGFVEGSYFSVVSSYLSESPDFPLGWEKMSSVKSRARGLASLLEKAEEKEVLVITHGMFLSVVLSVALETEAFEEWKRLEMGSLVEMEFSSLKKAFLS